MKLDPTLVETLTNLIRDNGPVVVAEACSQACHSLKYSNHTQKSEWNKAVVRFRRVSESLMSWFSFLDHISKNTFCSEENWRECPPWVVTDIGFKREWLFPTPLRYHLHVQPHDHKWSVCDRWTDLAAIDLCDTRQAAIRAFYKSHNRPIPTGEYLSSEPDFA